MVFQSEIHHQLENLEAMTDWVAMGILVMMLWTFRKQIIFIKVT